MTTPPLWERVFNLTSEDLNLGLECWAGSWVSWGALANILLFLSFFLISGERENEERLFCHYINFLFDSRTRRYHCPTSVTVPGTQLEQKSSSHGKQLWRLWPVLARAAPSWTQHRLEFVNFETTTCLQWPSQRHWGALLRIFTPSASEGFEWF